MTTGAKMLMYMYVNYNTSSDADRVLQPAWTSVSNQVDSVFIDMWLIWVAHQALVKFMFGQSASVQVDL